MTAFTKQTNSMHLFLGAVICVFASTLFISNTSYAETKHAPTSKESFLKSWKAHQKNLPTTVTFEKTDEPNTYIYETTLFPYKGKLKILNVVVDKNISYYYDYDLDSDNILKGIVEIDFPDLPEDFFKKHPYSHGLWERQGYLFFIDNRWVSADQWRELEEKNGASNPPAYRAPANFWSKNKKIISTFIPVAIIILAFLFPISRSNKMQKKQIEKYDLSMQRQEEAIEQQQQAFKLAEESLALQKEQTDYLRQLLKDKK